MRKETRWHGFALMQWPQREVFARLGEHPQIRHKHAKRSSINADDESEHNRMITSLCIHIDVCYRSCRANACVILCMFCGPDSLSTNGNEPPLPPLLPALWITETHGRRTRFRAHKAHILDVWVTTQVSCSKHTPTMTSTCDAIHGPWAVVARGAVGFFVSRLLCTIRRRALVVCCTLPFYLKKGNKREMQWRAKTSQTRNVIKSICTRWVRAWWCIIAPHRRVNRMLLSRALLHRYEYKH